jgi:uncharacterized protein
MEYQKKLGQGVDRAANALVSAAVPRREGLVDALRIVALLSVCIVNFTFYPIEPLRELPYAAGLGTAFEATLRALVASVFEAKGYPLLAFLFGYSFALSLRAHLEARGETLAVALAHRKARMWRLLGLGVLHGALLFFGDILLAYALCGFWLLRWAMLDPTQLVRRIQWLVVINVLLTIVAVAGNLWFVAPPGAAPSPSMAIAVGVGPWWRLNLSVWLTATAFLPLYVLPALMIPMLLGLLAARVHWLDDAARFAPQWRRVLKWALLVGVPLNLAFGASMVAMDARSQVWLVAVVMWPGLVMDAALVSGAALLWHRGAGNPATAAVLRWLAPAGRYTLSIYLTLSVLMVLLLSGAGFQLGLKLPFSALLAMAAAYWLVAVLIARHAAARGSRGLFERWMGA